MEILNPNPYGCLSVERLKKFETSLGFVLPQDYRNFLLEFNGGKWSKKLFHISDEEGDSIIHTVYGIHDGPRYLYLNEIHKIFSDRIPNGFLSIASDPGGNQICIGLVGIDRDRIFFFDHENVSCDLYLLNTSFAAFVESLSDIAIDEDELGKILHNDDIDELNKLIKAGYDVEFRDGNDTTLLERAAIKAKPRIIEFLASAGADLGQSLEYAKKNAKYFEKHKQIVELILKLNQQQ